MDRGMMQIRTSPGHSQPQAIIPGASQRPIRVTLGGFSASGTIRSEQGGQPTLLLSRQLRRRMGLQRYSSVAFQLDGDHLRLGPVLGILTAGPGPVPGNRQMFRYVSRAARQSGLLAYVFRPEDVDWQRRVVRGHQWQGGWRPGSFPLPDVVYNRIPNRQLEFSPATLSCKRRLAQRGIALFNPRFLDKQRLARLLSRDPAVSAHLPWTKTVRSLSDIDQAARRFGAVYLKPQYSFAGKGILRLSRFASGWVLRHRQNNRNLQHRFGSFTAASPTLRTLMGGKRYMVQQGISLAQFRGRNFDVRLLAQKGAQGQWQVTGMGVRVAGAGSITTHVPNGGYIAPIERVLPEVFGADHPQVMARVRDLALSIAPRVEAGYRGLFGEMSMDIGIDRQGYPWFFEANAKPMKFDEDRIRVKGLQTLISYVRHLARFRDPGGDA
ncbi:MAG: YheC/YheD family protein [Bacillota bacterium]|jgi:hypothetical protein